MDLQANSCFLPKGLRNSKRRAFTLLIWQVSEYHQSWPLQPLW